LTKEKYSNGACYLYIRKLLCAKNNYMRHLYLLFILLATTVKAQVNEGLSPEERAYLFHVVKKSPILDNELGRYFDYKGPQVMLGNKQINYDSVEILIINQPEILIIRKEEIAKSAKGFWQKEALKKTFVLMKIRAFTLTPFFFPNYPPMR